MIARKSKQDQRTGQVTAPRVILELIERFRRNIQAYKGSGYNETQVRREFLDPFFEALGWDMHNEQGWAETYKEVIHEDQIRVAGSARAPDYCFRIGGTRKFFVEAKRPNTDIKEDVEPAYQLRRYAWSAKLPLSIVTDFEEFAVYDCRVMPNRGDKASEARILYLTFEDYPTCWHEIAEIFSPDAILKGSFDRFAGETRGKRGTTEVDDAFLEEIERWREMLARNIALRNATITERDLNFAVQRIIDRIVFLRICEDRGIEDYERLKNTANAKGVYASLRERFAQADDKYNSGLFHFKPEPDRDETPDTLTQTLHIDDEPLREILNGLYYPDCPYVFAEIPADILGQVYERFLGKVIRLTAGHRAKVEERPEVRKAGGVYYTPTYIVDHIVKSTVGRLVEGNHPKDVAKLRILDPACGSGSFLLGAYQFLLDWHLRWYIEAGPEKYAKKSANERTPALFQGKRGDWQLTISKRKEILLNNIFGVDIDAQAIEVTKLSLLLQVLRGETEQALQKNLFYERALPDLGRNIQRGNSLVGPDFDNGGASTLLEPDRDAVAPFDWARRFPQVFESGGFDIVIGNPPYLSFGGRQVVELPLGVKEYFEAHYATGGWPTAHSLFMERSVCLLSKRALSFIVPDQVGHLDGYKSVREVVCNRAAVREVRYWGEHVFRGVTTPALTFVVDKQFKAGTVIIEKDGAKRKVDLKPGDVWGGSALQALLIKLASHSFSIKPYIADCGIRTTSASNQVASLKDAKGAFVAALEGKQIGRYWCAPPDIAVRFDTQYDLYKSRDEKYQKAAFLIRQTAAYPIVAPHEHTVYFRNSLHGLYNPDNGLNVRYLVGLLNSKLIRFAYVEKIREAHQKAFPQVKLGALAALPIHSIDLADHKDKACHDRVVEMVEQMLSLQKKLRAASDPTMVEGLRQQIDVLDDQLDRTIYDLYELTPAEVAAVEKVVARLVKPP